MSTKGEASCYPELAYLLDCLSEQTPLFPKSINQKHLRYLCEWHGLIPMVSQLGDATLKEKSQWAMSQALILRQELPDILQCLESHQIKALPFKGAMLADRLYTPSSVRPFGDNDVVVPRDDVRKALDALASIGYSHGLSFTQIDRLLYCHYEITLFHQDSGSKLELHWRCLPSFYGLGDEQLMDSGFWELLEGMPGYRLSPEREWLALTLHAFKDHWLRLINIQDLILLESQLTPAQIDARHRLVTQLGLERIFSHSHMLMQGIGGDNNSGFLEWLPYWNTTQRWAQESLYHWIKQARFVGGVSGACLPLRACLGLKETDIMATDLPKGTGLLYYLIRPMRLMKSKLVSRL